jgi:hypothetical protein
MFHRKRRRTKSSETGEKAESVKGGKEVESPFFSEEKIKERTERLSENNYLRKETAEWESYFPYCCRPELSTLNYFPQLF